MASRLNLSDLSSVNSSISPARENNNRAWKIGPNWAKLEATFVSVITDPQSFPLYQFNDSIDIPEYVFRKIVWNSFLSKLVTICHKVSFNWQKSAVKLHRIFHIKQKSFLDILEYQFQLWEKKKEMNSKCMKVLMKVGPSNYFVLPIFILYLCEISWRVSLKFCLHTLSLSLSLSLSIKKENSHQNRVRF